MTAQNTTTIREVLVLGASYGSLFATKLIMAGHAATLVCTHATADLINSQGTRVRLPVRGYDDLVEVSSKRAPGRLAACTPNEVDPAAFDLVVLAMQEPQYASPCVRELLGRIGLARIPCIAIMNMPPLPYLARIPDVDLAPLTRCYADPTIWEGMDPNLVTLASPDPQAFRPPDAGKNVLQVSLATNFKVARFGDDESTQVMRALAADIDAARFEPEDHPGEAIKLPVKFRVFDSIFVPMAKWSMLLTGNYRCVRSDDLVSIRDAVHADLDASREIYDWVGELCQRLGAAKPDLVAFDLYAKAAQGLAKPSSAARALFGGARNIERIDCLVHQLATQQGMQSDAVDEIVELVDRRLAFNRAA